MSNEFKLVDGTLWYIEDGKQRTGLRPHEVKMLDFFKPDWKDLPREEVVELLVNMENTPAPPPIKFASEMDLDMKITALVEDCFPSVGVGCLYAQPGIGKSAVAVDLAFRIASPAITHWAGRRINTHGDVLYVALEGDDSLRSFIRGWRREHPDEFAGARVAFYTVSESDQDLRPLVVRQVDKQGDYYENPGIDQLKKWIEQKGLAPRLVVLDTQVDMMDPGVSENDAGPSSSLYRAAGRLAADLECFVLFLHHAVKTASRSDKPTYRGSTAFAAKADIMAYLQGVSSGRGDGKLAFEKRKPFGGPDPRVRYAGVRDEHGDDLCVSWDGVDIVDLLDEPEVEKVHRRARTVSAIWRVLTDANQPTVDLATGEPILYPNPFSTSAVANAMRELATREEHSVDVLYSRKSIGDLLDELNAEGIVVNLEDTMASGRPAKWVAGRQPAEGGDAS